MALDPALYRFRQRTASSIARPFQDEYDPQVIEIACAKLLHGDSLVIDPAFFGGIDTLIDTPGLDLSFLPGCLGRPNSVQTDLVALQVMSGYAAYSPGGIARGGVIASPGGVAGFVMAVIASINRARHDKASTPRGSARWACEQDMRRAGLFGGDGIILGRMRTRDLRHAGAAHVISFAANRSGKVAGLVVPALLTLTGSAIKHPIKGENWQLAPRRRSGVSRCIRFDPTSLSGARFAMPPQIAGNDLKETEEPRSATDHRPTRAELGGKSGAG